MLFRRFFAFSFSFSDDDDEPRNFFLLLADKSKNTPPTTPVSKKKG
jgi:hypothetical protein